MKYLLMVTLVFINLTLSANPLSGVLRFNPVSANCLRILHENQKLEYSYIQVFNENGTYTETQKQQIQDSINAGLKLMAKFSFCKTKDLLAQANSFINKTNINAFDIIWIDATFNTSRIDNCTWDLLTPQMSCNYIKTLTSFFQSKGKEVGIISSPDDFRAVLQNTCNELGNLKLWTRSDFSPFGGWSNYTITQKLTSQKLCGQSASAFFYEII